MSTTPGGRAISSSVRWVPPVPRDDTWDREDDAADPEDVIDAASEEADDEE